MSLFELNCYFRKQGSNIIIDEIGPKYDTVDKKLFFYPVHIQNSDKATIDVFRKHHPKVDSRYNNYLIFNKDKKYIRYTAIE